MATADAAAAHVRFLVVRRLPTVVVDLEPTDDREDPPGAEEAGPGLFATLMTRGLLVLPGVLDTALPRGARVGFTLTTDELRLEDDEETRYLRAPRAAVPADWEAEAKRLNGTMLYVGRDLGVDPDLSPRAVFDLLERASRRGEVIGAIVGVAEPRVGLPLIG